MKSSLSIKILACLVLFALASCAGTGDSGDNQFNAVVKEDTPLNESGPRQTTPAAVLLHRGDRVRIVNGENSQYPYVETISGDRGFVSKDILEKQGDH